MMTKTNRFYLPLSVLVLSLLTACGGPNKEAMNRRKATASQPVGTKEAQTMFESLCVTCHGKTGKGDGPGAIAIDPKPRSFSDESWQESVTDEQIGKVIVYGGAAIQKSEKMPPNPQLKSKPEVVKALTKIVRDFRGK